MACIFGGGKKSSAKYKDVEIAASPYLTVTLTLPGQKTVLMCNEVGTFMPLPEGQQSKRNA